MNRIVLTNFTEIMFFLETDNFTIIDLTNVWDILHFYLPRSKEIPQWEGFK